MDPNLSLAQTGFSDSIHACMYINQHLTAMTLCIQSYIHYVALYYLIGKIRFVTTKARDRFSLILVSWTKRHSGNCQVFINMSVF